MIAVMHRRGAHGFTLVELMAVVAIIAILAMVAVPNYASYAMRARRVDAQLALLRIADAQERYYAANNNYGNKLADLGITTAMSEQGHYRIQLRPKSGEGFIAIATPIPEGAQARDACKALYIDDAGVKGQTGGTTNGRCW